VKLDLVHCWGDGCVFQEPLEVAQTLVGDPDGLDLIRILLIDLLDLLVDVQPVDLSVGLFILRDSSSGIFSQLVQTTRRPTYLGQGSRPIQQPYTAQENSKKKPASIRSPKRRTRTKIKVRSIQLFQRILQGRLRVPHIRRIQLGSQKYLFTGNARQLDPFLNLFLVLVRSSGYQS